MQLEELPSQEQFMESSAGKTCFQVSVAEGLLVVGR